ncbi:DENN domain-containing protein 5B-like [Sarcoptes scabiei]|nr:DENN domain-containing protein 5B-like [Sarcoptes scabiei]
MALSLKYITTLITYFLIVFSGNEFKHRLKMNLNCSLNSLHLNRADSNCLNCSDVKRMKPVKLLDRGIVKKVWLVDWDGNEIVVSKLTNPIYQSDFFKNLKNLLEFQSSKMVTKVLGFCGHSIFYEYYRFGNMNNLHSILPKYRLFSFKSKFKFCIDYVQIINFLHQSSMVMCDSNSLQKTLSQYLISDNLEILLNDMDACPKLSKNKTIICGHRSIRGDLVAPEQIIKGNHYDHRIDIWKIPDVCHWIIKDTKVPSFSLKILHWIHGRCKSLQPTLRPDANNVLSVYQIVMYLLP